MIVTLDSATLATLAAQTGAAQTGATQTGAAQTDPDAPRALPPVHLWNPPFCGKMDMRIARDGSWHHEGSPINREAMVRLFSSILKREDDRYMLVTPAEKVEIQVDDLPLHAVDVEQLAAGQPEAEQLIFTLRTGERVTLSPDHLVVVDTDPQTGEPAPRLHVRAGLWARIDRKTFLRMVEFGCQGLHDGASWFGLRSLGHFFPVIATSDLI